MGGFARKSSKTGGRKRLAGPSFVDIVMTMMIMIVIMATTETMKGLRFPFGGPCYQFQPRVQLC